MCSQGVDGSVYSFLEKKKGVDGSLGKKGHDASMVLMKLEKRERQP